MEVVDRDHQDIDGSLHEDVIARGGRDVGVVEKTVGYEGDLFHPQDPTPALVAPEVAAGQMRLLPWQHPA
jgi:hypothetical protein